MKVTVKVLGIPLKDGGRTQQTLNLPAEADLRQLIEKLISDTELTFQEAVRATSYMVNNRKADLDTKLCDGDQILVMRMLGGG